LDKAKAVNNAVQIGCKFVRPFAPWKCFNMRFEFGVHKFMGQHRNEIERLAHHQWVVGDQRFDIIVKVLASNHTGLAMFKAMLGSKLRDWFEPNFQMIKVQEPFNVIENTEG